MRELQELLDAAERFRFGHLTVEKRGPDVWVVSDGFGVLNEDGDFEIEPLPSSRTFAFLARTRFSRDEAVRHAVAATRPASFKAGE